MSSLASDSFRMGVREAAAAMCRGGLLSLLNVERAGQAAHLLEAFEPQAIAALLHDMSGPFNFRLLSTDIDTRLVHSADRVSSLVAMAIAEDVRVEQGAGHEPELVSKRLIEAFCAWIDVGNAVSCIPISRSEAGRIAALMAFDVRVDSSEAANVRMLAVARFAAALGAIGVVLRVPRDLPMQVERAN